MLVLGRHVNECIIVRVAGRPDLELSILVTEVRAADGRVRLGFDGPKEFQITRAEIDGTSRGVPRSDPAWQPHADGRTLPPRSSGSGIGWGPQS